MRILILLISFLIRAILLEFYKFIAIIEYVFFLIYIALY